MSLYDELKIKELQALTKQRGLPFARSYKELIAALEADDCTKTPEFEVEPPTIVEEPEFSKDPTPPVQEHTGCEVWLQSPNRVRVSYTLDVPFTDDLHLQFRLKTVELAEGMGLAAVGGTYGARKVSLQGGRVIYEVRVIQNNVSSD